MNSKAWDILLDEEKAALSLSINHSKSTWQAGEILNKAHYKYLEIHARAKKFFVMFTQYFKKTGDRLIPDNSEMSWDLREFILCTIEERKGYRETLKIIGKTSPLCSKYAKDRDNKLIEYMDWLKSQDGVHRDLHDLIKEFDRWNNFRILPESIQEPSAFKRRNKTRLLKHLKNVYSLEPIVIDYLSSNRFKPSKKGKRLYLPIVSDNYIKGYNVIEVNVLPQVIKYISKELQLYLFEDKHQADDYAHLVEAYMSSTKRTCKVGQNFWPEFRTMIKLASNYNEVNNIIPRRSKLEVAFRDIDKIKISKKNGKSILEDYNGAENRLNDDKLWNL